MNIKLFFTICFCAGALCSAAQDTTGGTRPNVVIPFHSNKNKNAPETDRVSFDPNAKSAPIPGVPQRRYPPKAKAKKRKPTAKKAVAVQ